MSDTDTQIDVLRSCDPYGEEQILLHRYTTQGHRASEREAEEEMVRQHSWRLCGDESIHLPSYTTRWRHSQVEEHCPQQGLPEREDIVIVAKALSQVN